jgi:cytosine/adenosine deaminase-related metal-dependent hydrolase
MLIKNANLITFDHKSIILENHDLYIDDWIILDLGPESMMSEKYPDEKVFDAGGQYILPGNICAHTHFYGAFARGMAIPGSAPENFLQILQKLWWPLDMALDEEAILYSALVCLVDAIKHGTTTLIDHHASPNFIDGSLDVINEAVEKSGLRAVLCYEVTDRNELDGAKAGIAENLRFIKKCNSQNGLNTRVAATFGLHASFTLSDATLQACRESVPDEVGFHIHVAEHKIDEDDCLEKYRLRVVDRLDRNGLLGDHSIVVHAVNVDAHEIALLADTGPG